MSYQINSEDDLPVVAVDLLQDFGNQKVILFEGEMGVGKTTLI